MKIHAILLEEKKVFDDDIERLCKLENELARFIAIRESKFADFDEGRSHFSFAIQEIKKEISDLSQKRIEIVKILKSDRKSRFN